MAVLMEGLRERKKRQTREAIAAAAMELFRLRGYDAVTVADVARAADVSEKTVFNYFPTKEDLVFAPRRGAPRGAGRGDPRARRRGASLVEPFRAADDGARSTASSTGAVDAIAGRAAARAPAARRCASGCCSAGSARRRELDAGGRRGDGAATTTSSRRWSRARWRGRTGSSSAPPSGACSPARTSARWPPTCASRRAAPTTSSSAGWRDYGVR